MHTEQLSGTHSAIPGLVYAFVGANPVFNFSVGEHKVTSHKGQNPEQARG